MISCAARTRPASARGWQRSASAASLQLFSGVQCRSRLLQQLRWLQSKSSAQRQSLARQQFRSIFTCNSRVYAAVSLHACQPCNWGDRVRFYACMRPNELHRCAGEVFGQHNQLQLASSSCTARIAAQPSSRKYKNVFATTAAPLVLWGDAHTDYCQAPAHLQPPQPHQTLIICACPPRRRAASRRNAIMP